MRPPEGADPAPAPEDGPVLDQQWIEEQTGRRGANDNAAPPRNGGQPKVPPPVVKAPPNRPPPPQPGDFN